MRPFQLVWIFGVVLLLATASGQETEQANAIEDEAYDDPPALRPGEVEIFADVECPDGTYPDPDRLSSPNTKICVEARLNCKPGVSWRSQCNTCTCSEGTNGLGRIECTRDDCTGYVYPEQDFGNTRVCDAEVFDCPTGCGFVRRDSGCIYCQCDAEEEPQKTEE